MALWPAAMVIAAGFNQTVLTAPVSYIYRLSRDSEVRGEVGRAWIEDARAFLTDLPPMDGTFRKKLLTRSVLSVALVTYRYCGNDAQEFWKNVVLDDRLSAKDPRKLLHYALLVPDQKQTWLNTSRLVATAWNNASREEQRTRLTVRQPELPIAIEETPYTRDHVMVSLLRDGTIVREPVPLHEQSTTSLCCKEAAEAA